MQPVSEPVFLTSPVTFSVTVASIIPVSYVWLKNDVPIPGATASTYTISSAQASDAANYSVVVSNAAGSITSNEASLKVLILPLITQQPANQSVLVGQPAIFTVAVSSPTQLYYQWLSQAAGANNGIWTAVTDGADYSGSNSARLSVLNPALVNSGDQYRVELMNFDGSDSSNPVTLTVDQPGFVKFSAGRYHSLRLDIVADLYATGTNTYGQLGTGSTTTIATPQQVSLPSATIADLAAGAQHSLILTNAKELWVAGFNGNGQLGDGTLVNKATPFKLATTVAGMAAAVFHSAYVKTDGTLWTFGGNDSGQLGNGTTTDSATPVQVATGVIDVALGNHQSLFLKSDGSLWGMGDMNNTTAPVSTPVQVAANVTSLATGAFHTLFIKADGTLWGLGFNSSGQLGNGTTTTALTPVQIDTGVKAVAAGYFFSAYLKTDGTLWVMGANGAGQLGDGTTTSHSTPFLLASNVASVSASESYTLFTKLDGSLWATGYNANGQFGNGSTASVSTPVQIATGTVLAPATPAGLAASTVATLDRVHLLWTPSADARTYEVWRNTVNDSSTAARLATVRWAIYEDLTAANGQGYFYWIRAVNPAGTSAFSTPVLGSSSNAVAPTITTPPASQAVNVGDTVNFSVAASGTAPFTYQWRKDGGNLTDAGSLSGSTTATLTITGAQTTDAGNYDVVVTNAAGNSTSAAATLTVSQLAQSITFAPLVDTAYTPVPFTLSATASSGLTVSFSVVSGPANVSGNSVTLTGVGTVTVRAAQGGNATYSAAANVDRSFNVTTAGAAVTLGSLNPTYDGNAHAATATTNPPGLTVTFTYDGAPGTPTNAGSYAVVGTVVDANYAGSANGTLVIAPASQTIAFTGPANQPFSFNPISLSASATSGLPVSFSVQAGNASLSGNLLTLSGTGLITVRASQPGDSNHNPSPSVDQSFTVSGDFEAWRAANFTATELGQAVSGPTAVAAQDGLPNLVKYALGLAAKTNATSGLPVLTTDGTTWIYTFTTPSAVTADPATTVTVQYSSDLSTRSTVTQTMTGSDSTTDTWQAGVPVAGNPNLFFRLSVTH
ncbi:MAG: MBG domain-containing protein [Opitutales bacterium]